ncbi:MAG: NADH:ubiquinone reductase (Na(+)-transporting) subunit B [Bacteroidales bacterium]|nr:NADH:ubiquinone reductase (Na(+)-transporting) subunit B [Bacteroidales bacterium]MBN2755744.1 NADH:ubiquinone reductase (Na(+)-transporting) subunit B [Bacteroidales bacterium]
MKALRNYLDKIKPNFEKGGKHEKWLSVFESFETFLYVLGDTAPKKGAHIRDAVDLKRVMSVVVIALIPTLLFGMWNVGDNYYQSIGQTDVNLWQSFGYGFIKVIPLVLVSYIAGLGTEFVFVYIKGHEIEEGFLVSGLLIPLIVPVDVPLWMLALATIFSVIFGKEVFGGTGMNVVNPALLTRAFLFFAYPAKMSGDTIWISELSKGEGIVDGFSGATPLANAAAGSLDKLPSTMDMFLGFMPGSIGETSALAILIGAAILLFTGVGSWKIMLSVFIGGITMGLLLNLFATDTNPYMALPWYHHLLLGGFAFGAVFMATDPVTAAQTEKGKWIYGFLIGFIAILVRVLNPAYPEGMMMAILLLNVFSPLIDHYVIQGNIKKRLKRAKAL